MLAALAAGGAAGQNTAVSVAPPVSMPVEPATLAVFGDSLGDGLWGSLFRRFAWTNDVRVHRGSKAATGFNRTPYEEGLEALLDEQPIRVAIMFTGANDAQDAFPLEAGGQGGLFFSANWLPLYRRRLRRFHQLAAARNLPLLWIGLPTMRDAWFEARIARVRAAQREVCHEFDVPYLDLAPMSANPAGTFTDAAGVARALRYEDGIHLTAHANDGIADMALHWLLDEAPAWIDAGMEQRLRHGLR